jgi:SAM-dependent methyltransferase
MEVARQNSVMNDGAVLRAANHEALAAARYRAERIKLWNGYVRKPATTGYYRRLAEIYRYLVPAGSRVLELGSGTGDLLAALEPSMGVGIDFAPEMLKRAAQSHPQLRFVQDDVHQLSLNAKFDYVIVSDLINDLWDVQTTIERVASVCTPATRVIINTFSRMWELPLRMAGRMNLANPPMEQNWLTLADLDNMLALGGFEVIRQWQEVLLPLALPLLAPFCNRYVVKLWPFRYLALTNLIVARLAPEAAARARGPEPVVSVIVPARNEAGNIENVVQRVPEMGAGTEIVFVEGHSRDDTYAAIEEAIARHPERRMQLLRQSGAGKGDAVRLGFAEATGGVLMILDADLTVAPEDLPRFYRALRSGRGEFINGVRFVYPMEKQAMRFLNFLGNKFFSLGFSWLLGQNVKDTLCGTKVLSRADYDTIAVNRAYFGDFDPFGDFDLIFGAAKLDLKIVDMLLRMFGFALRRLKFV